MLDTMTEIFKFRETYQQFEEYQGLQSGDKKFFDNLFLLLVVSTNVEYTNKYLSIRFNTPISTVEKRLKRLEWAHMIVRSVIRIKKEDKYWISVRTIHLDPKTFAFINVAMAPIEFSAHKTKEKEEIKPIEEPKEEIKKKKVRMNVQY